MTLLTDIAIRQFPFTQAGQKDYADQGLPGFCLRVGQTTKTFQLVLKSGKRKKRHTLGRYPFLTLSEARQKAKILIGEHQKRRDDPSLVPFKEAYERFMLGYKVKNRPKTVSEMDGFIKRFLEPRAKTVQDLNRSVLVQIIDSIEHASVAHKFYTCAYTFLKWCQRYGIPHPLLGVEKPPKPKARTRLITTDEFLAIWKASHELGTYGRLVRFLFLTGQRRNQGAYLDAAWINQAEQVIDFPTTIMKAKREFSLPYGPLTASLLGNTPPGLQFPSEKGTTLMDWAAKKKLLDKLSGVTGWVHHDARRFYSTTHSMLKTPPHIRELLLDHSIGSAVGRIYDRWSYLEEKREAQLAYESHISKLLEPA